MTSKHILLLAVLLAALGGVSWALFARQGGGGSPGSGESQAGRGEPAEQGGSKPAAGQGSEPEPAPITVSKPAAAGPAKLVLGSRGKPPAGAAVFPDGTWMPPLNGCPFAPGPCPWPGTVPYSPIVRIATGDGNLQWWIHADGSQSTTQMVKRTEGDKVWHEPGWAVGNPTKTLPVDIGSGAGPGSGQPPIRIGQ